MENKNYYLYAVLNGLIKAYQENERKLQELNAFLRYDGDKLDDYYLSIQKWTFSNAIKLICKYSEKKNYLQRLIISIQKSLNIYYYPKNSADCLLTEGDKYAIDNSKHDIYIASEFQSEFDKKTGEILTSDFARNILLLDSYTVPYQERIWHDKVWLYFFHNHFRINFSRHITEKTAICCEFIYSAHDDVLSINMPISEFENLQTTLPHLKLNASVFNDYHRSLFDFESQPNLNKELIIGDTTIENKRNMKLIRIKNPQV